MLFTHDVASGLADGTITLTFRTWSKPQAKVGGRYRTCGLLLEVTSVKPVDPMLISSDDARLAGYASVEDLRRKLAAQGQSISVWRVEFRCLGLDDRIARRNDDTLDLKSSPSWKHASRVWIAQAAPAPGRAKRFD